MDDIQVFNLMRRRRREMDRERNLRIRANKLRLRRIRDASDPFAIPDEVFQGLYRLNKALARRLIEELRPFMHVPRRSTAVPPEIKVLCALHFYGQGCYQKGAGSDSNLGLSQPTVSVAIEEVTNALNLPQVLAKWIHFPLTREERNRVIQRNYLASQIPGTLGYIDGTHVAIKAPRQEENVYLNRKHYHSLNVMIICDSDLVILNCVSRFGGSNHDAYIWNESTLKTVMMEMWRSGHQCWLLGDSGYPQQPWLQTPIMNAEAGSPEAHYTRLHVRARSVVERCIGVLKARFRCLLRHRVLDYTPVKAGRIVNACIVLHNVCVRGGLDEPNEVENDDGHMPADDMPGEQRPRMALLDEARAVRRRLVARLQP